MAMAILAIAGMAIVGVTRDGLISSQHLNEKRPAFWVAENTLTDIRLSGKWSGKWPSGDWQKQSVVMDDRVWFVQSRSIKTVTGNLRSIEVEVRTHKDSATAIAQLQTHMLKP